MAERVYWLIDHTWPVTFCPDKGFFKNHGMGVRTGYGQDRALVQPDVGTMHSEKEKNPEAPILRCAWVFATNTSQKPSTMT